VAPVHAGFSFNSVKPPVIRDRWSKPESSLRRLRVALHFNDALVPGARLVGGRRMSGRHVVWITSIFTHQLRFGSKRAGMVSLR